MSEFLGNPTATGLLGGVGVLFLQFAWKRFMGTDEKSIPLQLAEINTKLAGIETTLQLMKMAADHDRRDHEELKQDFWNHMDRHHGGGGGRAHSGGFPTLPRP